MRGLLVRILLLCLVGAVLAGCGGTAGPDQGEAGQRSSATSPDAGPSGSPTGSTDRSDTDHIADTGNLVVCARVAPLIARINGQFNTLATSASQRRRSTVARSFDQAHDQIRTIIAQAGLDSASPVRTTGLAVAMQTARVARLLRMGAAVGNAELQAAQRQLGHACTK